MDYDIKRDRRGYFTLTVNGEFEGNYDTMREAAQACEARMREEERG